MKIQKFQGVRVVVEIPRTQFGSYNLSQREQEQEAKRVKNEIERHVDGAHTGRFSLVSIEFDQPTVCEFCGEPWDSCIVDLKTEEPGCCNKAVEEWNSQHPKQESTNA